MPNALYMDLATLDRLRQQAAAADALPAPSADASARLAALLHDTQATLASLRDSFMAYVTATLAALKPARQALLQGQLPELRATLTTVRAGASRLLAEHLPTFERLGALDEQRAHLHHGLVEHQRQNPHLLEALESQVQISELALQTLLQQRQRVRMDLERLPPAELERRLAHVEQELVSCRALCSEHQALLGQARRQQASLRQLLAVVQAMPQLVESQHEAQRLLHVLVEKIDAVLHYSQADEAPQLLKRFDREALMSVQMLQAFSG